MPRYLAAVWGLFQTAAFLGAADLTVLPNAADSHTLALTDLLTLPLTDRPFIRYLWLPADKDLPRHLKAVSYALNWTAVAGVPHRPPVLGGLKQPDGSYGQAVVRVDLRWYAPRPEDLERWLKTWELLTFDPNYSRLITHDSLALLAKQGKLPPGVKEVGVHKVRVDCPPYRENGQEWREKWVTLVRLPAPYLNPADLSNLEVTTGSTAPVVHWQYFVMRSLASIQDEGLYQDLFGGLYYELAGIRTAKQAGKKKATDLDQLFEDLGILDDADGKLTAQAKLDRLQSEQRVAMLRSDVTGKARVVFVLPTLKSVRKRGLLMLTGDIKDSNFDLQKDPFANLLDFAPDAREGFFIDSNGTIKNVLYDAAGTLLREVPPDVAVDHTIPAPYTRRLQTLSCPICHGGKGMDGWQPTPNQTQLKRRGLDLWGDVSDPNKTITETLDLLASKYAGNLDETLAELRRGTIGTTLQAIGPWPDDKDQTGSYTLVAAEIEAARRSYWYTPIDARRALLEMGLDPGKGDALALLQRYLPPDVASASDLLSFIPEDVRIGQLLSGRSLNRADWELVKGFVATRVYQTLALTRGKP